MKYQFCIRFDDIDRNSAASKAVLDCNAIFSRRGYTDFTLTVANNSNRLKYYGRLLKTMSKFFFRVKAGSAVGVQYPLLSINNVFKYFIQLARLKKVYFFCVVHDLHSLRTGGKNNILVKKEIDNLDGFDEVIVHNETMLEWLRKNGLNTKASVLGVFDYLSDDFELPDTISTDKNIIVYAGNLAKSKFIYSLDAVKNCSFRLYGPGFNAAKLNDDQHVKWMGQYSPEEIAKEIRGNFGLIWDGDSCDVCDDVLGNYLRYNAPHKFSLYITAGLPVIAPADSAIGSFIKENKIGLTVNNLHELADLSVAPEEYVKMKENVLVLRKKIISGGFFMNALKKTEQAAA